MYNIIYISTAVRLMGDYELAEILDVSREKNRWNGITGMLLYADGTFIQVLEGEKEAILKTFKSIANDLRHKNLIELASGSIKQRNFAEWTMGFASVNSDVLKEFEGYSNPAGKGFLMIDNMNAAVVMLKSFADNNRMS